MKLLCGRDFDDFVLRKPPYFSGLLGVKLMKPLYGKDLSWVRVVLEIPQKGIFIECRLKAPLFK
jgi:hypothetical protein